MNIRNFVKENYDIDVLEIKKYETGAASDTYYLQSKQGEFILKKPCKNEINHPEHEAKLCEYLRKKGIPVTEFVTNIAGATETILDGEMYRIQKYIEGKDYELNTAPKWMMVEMAAMLGRIHSAIREYPDLPEGIGINFFRFMTPENALKSYASSLEKARNIRDEQLITDILYRINLINRFPYQTIDFEKLTVGNTHGDYFISQIIVNKGKIEGVTDWTAACRHPLVWEIIRSFVYAEPDCIEGEIPIEKLITYLKEYLRFNQLNKQDILMMPIVFYYQIAVCDYYGQYMDSREDNREIFRHQAIFSTKLMRWFDKNMDNLLETLEREF